MASKQFDVRNQETAVQDNLVRFTYRLYAHVSEHPANPATQEVYEVHVKLPPSGLRASNLKTVAQLATPEAIKDLNRAGRLGSF